ncbi:tyrosine-type recombinase/integrase [uncultured Jatrophihabitans sp.]|uniref:tyrosine-type recombinase/integrase n=1 Tax=uncultured Jatrophihabitans sp. TaxID=1610747 RepID=UPI0035C98986
MSLRHYTAPTTGTVVPLLHIVPSKTDCERLIPMAPELVQVLLAVLRRAKAGAERVPLSIGYDPHEKLHGEPFPHLFARPVGTRQEVLSTNYVACVLGHLASVAGLTDAGQPIRFTPHDFRRLFATDAVNNGLPLHIAAALLGHVNLDTTRGYTAVFPQHIVTAHQAFIERRRELQPTGEDRVAEPDEWAEFQEHSPATPRGAR